MSSSSAFSPDHLSPTSDQLCYVHCNFCDTVLAVSFSSLFSPSLLLPPYYLFSSTFPSSSPLSSSSSVMAFSLWVFQVSVPCTSLFKTVTVRCGHCTNLLSVNMRGLLLPAANQLHLGHSLFSPHNLLVYHHHNQGFLFIFPAEG